MQVDLLYLLMLINLPLFADNNIQCECV